MDIAVKQGKFLLRNSQIIGLRFFPLYFSAKGRSHKTTRFLLIKQSVLVILKLHSPMALQITCSAPDFLPLSRGRSRGLARDQRPCLPKSRHRCAFPAFPSPAPRRGKRKGGRVWRRSAQPAGSGSDFAAVRRPVARYIRQLSASEVLRAMPPTVRQHLKGTSAPSNLSLDRMACKSRLCFSAEFTTVLSCAVFEQFIPDTPQREAVFQNVTIYQIGIHIYFFFFFQMSRLSIYRTTKPVYLFVGFGSLGFDPLLTHSKLPLSAGVILDLPKGKEGNVRSIG